ncbi:acyl-protein synthetase [Vibrio rhizosphaerae]|uniref:LuxE/PaaK family acyltransferase n=1 Tax=Vibrio rhizosphaerae TaxID=398736 RepID=UPI00056F0292|nr:acyl-protein synthetase [Vibrio rhizosphaerae]
MKFDEIINMNPFFTHIDKKINFQFDKFMELTDFHKKHCTEYSKILQSMHFDIHSCKSIEQIPYIPVQLFKEYDLKSISDEDVFKVMTSSGTTGQRVSKIFLNKETASQQTKVLSASVNSFIGKKRMPMLIIDSPSVLRDRANFSARGAGILGFSIFAREKVFALNDDMTLNVDGILSFLRKYESTPIFLFGFTYIIWLHFVKQLIDLHIDIDLSKGILFHGGGWKKLVEHSVSEEHFRDILNKNFSLRNVHNYYGMVEQTGSIFIECEYGHMHTSIFNDVLVRSTRDLSVLPPHHKGIIQVFSILPSSYPGHSLLTEDEGEIIGLDGCPCGRTGTHFKIYGRLKNAELRGCSDTYEKPEK